MENVHLFNIIIPFFSITLFNLTYLCFSSADNFVYARKLMSLSHVELTGLLKQELVVDSMNLEHIRISVFVSKRRNVRVAKAISSLMFACIINRLSLNVSFLVYSQGLAILLCFVVKAEMKLKTDSLGKNTKHSIEDFCSGSINSPLNCKSNRKYVWLTNFWVNNQIKELLFSLITLSTQRNFPFVCDPAWFFNDAFTIMFISF